MFDISIVYVVTRYFETKSSEKSKQTQRQPGPFIQMQICFLTKRKIDNWPIYGQAYISTV